MFLSNRPHFHYDLIWQCRGSPMLTFHGRSMTVSKSSVGPDAWLDASSWPTTTPLLWMFVCGNLGLKTVNLNGWEKCAREIPWTCWPLRDLRLWASTMYSFYVPPYSPDRWSRFAITMYGPRKQIGETMVNIWYVNKNMYVCMSVIVYIYIYIYVFICIFKSFKKKKNHPNIYVEINWFSNLSSPLHIPGYCWQPFCNPKMG